MATTLVRNLTAKEIKKRQPVDIFTGDPIEITDVWQDISAIINVKGAKSIVLWVNYDQNTSTNTKIRALVGATDDDVNYSLVIEYVSTSKVDVQDEVLELSDEDLKVIKEFTLNRAINYIKFQVADDADGTGQVDSAKVSIGEE